MNSLWFILIVVGFQLVGWAFKKVSEQAQKRRAEQAIKRAELEALRTGRAVESPEAERVQNSDDRRREELAELRRRAAARREPKTTPAQVQQPRGGSVPSPLEILLNLPPGSTTGGTVSPKPARLPKPSRKSKTPRVDPEVKRQREEAERRKQVMQQQAEEARRREAQRGRQLGASLSQREVPHTSALEHRLLRDAKPVPGATDGPPTLAPRSAAEWRRVIAMNEVLSKPITLR